MSSDQRKPEKSSGGKLNRRSFLRGSLGAAGGLVALAAALEPLRELDSSGMTVQKFLQKHYKELSPGEMETVVS